MKLLQIFLIVNLLIVITPSKIISQEINQFNTQGEKEGMWIVKDSLLYKMEEGEYKNGVKDGLWIEYYPLEIAKSKGTYKSGKKNGLWSFYDYDGELLQQGEFVNDVKEGNWIDTTVVSDEETGYSFVNKTEGQYKNGKKER